MLIYYMISSEKSLIRPVTHKHKTDKREREKETQRVAQTHKRLSNYGLVVNNKSHKHKPYDCCSCYYYICIYFVVICCSYLLTLTLYFVCFVVIICLFSLFYFP